MSDVYVVRIESVQGPEATFRVATIQGGTSYASTRSFAMRLLFDAARRAGELEIRELQRVRDQATTPAEEEALEEAYQARLEELRGRRRNFALARAYGDEEGPYEDEWFGEHLDQYIESLSLHGRRNAHCSEEALDRRRAEVEKRTTLAPSPTVDARTQMAKGWLDELHSYALTVRVVDPRHLEHLRVGDIFFTAACDLWPHDPKTAAFS